MIKKILMIGVILLAICVSLGAVSADDLVSAGLQATAAAQTEET